MDRAHHEGEERAWIERIMRGGGSMERAHHEGGREGMERAHHEGGRAWAMNGTTKRQKRPAEP